MSNQQSVGGQAVIEGVMMRGRNHYSVAVRLPDNSIKTKVELVPAWSKFFDKPFLRGIKALVENLKIGYRTLQWSADMQEEAENEKKGKEKKSGALAGFISILISVVLAVGLFIVVPNLAVHFLGIVEKDSPLLFNFISGGIRLTIFLGYVLAISMIKDVRRIFQYHGAEHKVIHAFEDKKELSYSEVQPYPTLHKRCGTSFLFLLIFVGILLFALVPPLLGLILPGFVEWKTLIRKVVIIGSHLVLLPFLASLSYEILKISAKKNWIGKTLVFLAYPGLFFQKITTKEPDEAQVEVAVRSLEVLLEKEKQEKKTTEIED